MHSDPPLFVSLYWIAAQWMVGTILYYNMLHFARPPSSR